MKRLIYIMFALLPLMAGSQNMYNITDLLDNAPSGTARFISMGGSMSALGGDLSVMGTNPAGTAIYRSCDFNLTGAFDYVKNSSEYNGTASLANYNGFSLGNLGFVLACEIDDSPVKYVNFGGNYRRKVNFSNNFDMYGASDGSISQQYIIADYYDQNPFELANMSSDMYTGFQYNWLALLAADAGLTDKEGNFLINPKTGLIYMPNELGYYSEQRGNLNVFDMNVSANINDMLYIGATVGYHKLDYSRYSFYEENAGYKRIYSLTNNYNLRGSGYDFKLGAILRPFKYSPFRIAAYVHTPVLYELYDSYSASIEGPKGVVFETESEACFGDKLFVEYSLVTPWRFGAAMSYTFGKTLALNAEYEYADATYTTFTDGNDIDMAQNDQIALKMKAQHTLRLGAELSFGWFALRAGYNYISSPFNAGAFKCMDNAITTDTSTEYMNKFSKNIATLGMGYRGKLVYFDVAYMYQKQVADFYPFYDYYTPNPGAKVGITSHTALASIGIRF